MKLIVSKKWALSICPGKPRVKYVHVLYFIGTKNHLNPTVSIVFIVLIISMSEKKDSQQYFIPEKCKNGIPHFTIEHVMCGIEILKLY